MPRFPFGLYLVFGYTESRLQSDSVPVRLDAIAEYVPSYSASIWMDQFNRTSYDLTLWYLRVVFLLV